MMRRKGFYRRFRNYVFLTLAIGYAVAYFYFSSNSHAVLLSDEVYHVDHHDMAAATGAVVDLHSTKIQQEASTIAHVYKPVHPSTWCIDSKLKRDQKPGQPRGLSYLRISHSASATLKGINMRIAHNFAQRYGLKSCIRHDSDTSGMKYAQRDKMSYLWTFLRDPTDRAMSVVGATLSQQLLQSSNRDSFDPTMSTNLTGQTDNILVYRTLHMLQNATNDGILGQGFGGYQLEVCMQDYTRINEVIYPSNPTEVADVSQLIDSVSRTFQAYDFVGLVERFDESLVAMKLLLGLETSDILYFAAHRKEDWQQSRVGKKLICRKQFDWETDLLTQPLVKNFLTESKEWHAQNYGDYLFYQAANQSLDRTILRIGLESFTNELKQFRAILERSLKECTPIFPCSPEGVDQFNESRHDCMGGFVCGHRCLDRISA